MNVTLNHSFLEVPSQTYEDSKDMEDNLDVSSSTKLWSYEVKSMEKVVDAKLSPKNKGERHNK